MLIPNRMVFVFLVALGIAGCGGEKRSSSSKATKPPPGVLGVSDLMAQKGPSGQQSVEGIVTSLSAKDGLVGLTDCEEFAECGDKDCCEMPTLPVKWGGTAPEKGQRVRVVGSIEERSGGKVFVASSTTVVQAKGQAR